MTNENGAETFEISGPQDGFCCEPFRRAFGVAIGLAGFGPDEYPFLFVGLGIFPFKPGATAGDVTPADAVRHSTVRDRAIGLVRYCPFCGEHAGVGREDLTPLPDWDVRDLRGKGIEDICLSGGSLEGAVCTGDQALYLDGLPGMDLTGLLVDVSGGSYVRVLRPRLTAFDRHGHAVVAPDAYEFVVLTKPFQA